MSNTIKPFLAYVFIGERESHIFPVDPPDFEMPRSATARVLMYPNESCYLCEVNIVEKVTRHGMQLKSEKINPSIVGEAE